MKRMTFLSFDLVLFLAVAGLAIIGVLFVFSSGVNASGAIVSNEYVKQIIWGVTGIGLMIAFSFISYNTLRVYSMYIYAATLILLVVTLFVGREINGAHSWLAIGEVGIQPSEFAKLSTILFLALYLTGIGNGIRELPRFLLGFIIILAPLALIVLQPDMGTSLVYIPIFIIMTYIAGAQVKHLVFTTLTGFLMIVFGALPAMAKKAGVEASSLLGLLGDTDFFLYVILALLAITGLSLLGYRTLKQRYFYWIFFVAAIILCSSLLSLPLRTKLQGYQIDRMLIFLNPQSDRQGAGWNILQSITAIGSGGFWGKGFLQGTQSHYRYLPQQSTDFIFSIIAEEWGFLGGIIIIGLFTLILLRGMSIIWSSKDMYAMLIGGGILAMLFFHILVNVGMAMGVMPVTGIPLPMLSYGGSSLWTAMIGIGILMNVSRRRLRY